MKILDDLNQRIDTVAQSITLSEQIISGLRKDLEEAQGKAERAARRGKTARWCELALLALGAIAVIIVALTHPHLQQASAVAMGFVVLVVAMLEVIWGILRHSASQAGSDIASQLAEKTSILEGRRTQLDKRTHERDQTLGIVRDIMRLDTPYLTNFVSHYRLGTEEQRSDLRELLGKHGIEVSEELLVDMLEDEKDDQDFAAFTTSLADTELSSLGDHLRKFIAGYGRKGNKAYLLRLLKEKGLVEQDYTQKQLTQALAKREHEMRVEDLGSALGSDDKAP